MGTEIQFGIDLLGKCKFAQAFQVKDHSMDRRAFEQRNEEAIKTTMLRHEEVFKQQVRELHRLYSVQRMLMDELKSEIKRPRRSFSDTPKFLTSTTDSNFGYSFHLQSEKVHQNISITSRVAKGWFDLECPVQEESDSTEADHRPAVGPSSRMTHGGTADDDCCGVDLTLSVGGGGGRGGSSKMGLNESRPYTCTGLGYPSPSEPMGSTRSEIGFGGSSSSPASVKSDEDHTSSNPTSTLDQQGRSQKRAHWPFQGLSSNRM